MINAAKLGVSSPPGSPTSLISLSLTALTCKKGIVSASIIMRKGEIVYAKCSVDTESLILITIDSQQPREGKGCSHFDWRYVRWLQLESWSPDF